MSTPQEIIASIEQKLASLPPEMTEQRALLNMHLANAYADLSEFQERQHNLEKAIYHYQKALDFFRAGSHWYPIIQNNLGTVYRALSHIADQPANLSHAVDAYNEAVAHGNPAESPIDFMVALNNLGNVCWLLAQFENAEQNLQRAQTAFKEALKFIQPTEGPVAYATLQNNLGNIYQELAKINDPVEYLNQAVTAYLQGLKQMEVEEGSMAFASVKHNLGNAYRELAHHDEVHSQSYLEQAVAAYEEALEHYSPSRTPSAYIMTRANLGLVYAELFQLEDAIKSWYDAAGAAEASGASQAAAQYRQWIADTRAAIEADENIE